MKLRNKKTGEIREIKEILIDGMFNVNSLAELNEEWEDYEEPEEYYVIERADKGGVFIKTVQVMAMNHEWIEDDKQSGNYFETKEEAEETVEKLKAWKRLKDAGFRTYDICKSPTGFVIHFDVDWEKRGVHEDLDLLFGGEE